MAKSDLVKKLKNKHPNLSKTQINNIIEITLDYISKSLIKNQAIEIRSFGRFSTKLIKANPNARNPRTNQIIYVPEKKKISFKMSKHLKEEINKEL